MQNHRIVFDHLSHACTKTDTGRPNFGSPVKICVACYYSNHLNKKTATMLRFRNRVLLCWQTKRN